MKVYLSENYIVAYELHVQSLKNKQSFILWIMNVFDQLLIAHHENKILMKSDRASDNDDIVKNQDHRTKWEMKKKRFEEEEVKWKKTKTKVIKY
jgi:mannitol-specific phosphotransferase system IIBC component